MNRTQITALLLSAGVISASIAEYLAVRTEEREKREQIRRESDRQRFAIAFAAGRIAERADHGRYASLNAALADMEFEKIAYLETH